MSTKSSYHNFDTLLLVDWIRANKGDLTALRISGGSPEEDIEAWDKINEEHAQEFKTDRKHLEYLRLVKRRALKQLELVISEDLFIINDIDVLNEKIEALLKTIASTDGNSIPDTLIALTERTGTLITELNITAKYFFQMVKRYSNKK